MNEDFVVEGFNVPP
jgi:RimJ/RimL family protein N-acetyltransferase